MKDIFVHPSAILDEGCEIGEGTKIWHFCHIMTDAQIGSNCNLGQNIFVASKVKLGDNVKIQNNVSLYSGVECEDDVFLGPSMVFTNIKHPRAHVNRKDAYIQTLVKKGATIGANATIVCGVTIGRYALIGAGSVVTKDVPDHALIIGNPSRQIGWVSVHGERLEFDEDGIASCNYTGRKYKLDQNTVILID